VVDEPDAQSLAAIRRRLLPGGVLVMAVANRFGVGRLVGPGQAGAARRDTTGFGSREVDRMLAAAGFEHRTVLGAFPDHVSSRVLMAGELAARLPRLAAALPRMAGNEHRMWQDVVRGADALHHVNSIVVLATVRGEAASLWPADRLAVYLNTDRAANLCGRAEVLDGPAGPVIHRSPVGHGDAGAVRLRDYEEPVYDGPTMLELIHERPEHAVDLLGSWLRLVHDRWPELGPASWDLVPHNLVMVGDLPQPVDLEWEVDGTEPSDVAGRGLLLTADQLARQGWAGAGEGSTVYELAGWLAVATGHDLGLLDRVVEKEAWFQAVRTVGHSDSPALTVETEILRRAWADRLVSPVEAGQVEEVPDARR
jgi:hypothetical protein